MKFRLSLGVILLLLAGWAMQLPGQTTDAERKEFEAVKARADKGDAEAQLNVAFHYANGQGVARDPVKAAKYVRKAAEQGLASAQCRLGLLYSNGDGVKPDKAEAARWLHRAAAQGLAEAQFDLGICYAKGDGVGENAVEAVGWYRKAAAQGLPVAMCELGNCYLEGNGVPTDIPEGVKWTRKAAERGFAPAQNTLGLCYSKGRGVVKDYVEAYKWFNLAAAKGGQLADDAKMNLAMAERSLTPEQIAEGQRLAREFKPVKPGTTDEAPATPGKVDSGSAASPGPTAATDGAASSASQSGFVNVKAEDESYEIFVDGAFVGNTPAKVKLAEGSHVVEVKKSGFKDYRKQIQISAGSELTLRAVLEKP
jgi:TPR repeat protein